MWGSCVAPKGSDLRPISSDTSMTTGTDCLFNLGSNIRSLKLWVPEVQVSITVGARFSKADKNYFFFFLIQNSRIVEALKKLIFQVYPLIPPTMLLL